MLELIFQSTKQILFWLFWFFIPSLSWRCGIFSDAKNNHLLNGHYVPDIVLDSLHMPSNSILIEI